MQLLNVDFCAEFDHMPECDNFICISHEEGLCYKRSIFIKNLRFEKAMEVGALIWPIITSISAFKVIWISIVYLFVILVEYLKLHEVYALLEEVNVAKLLNMQHKLCAGSIHLLG